MSAESRNADYSLLKVAKLFEPGCPDTEIKNTCANIKSQVEALDTGGDFDRWWGSTLSGCTSAPLALSKLCALFQGLKIDVGGQDYYKITWQTVLKHKETGHAVTFYDYKGGISYGSDVYGKQAPVEFIDDLKDLIEVLKNPRCPHPYDGCVVGEEA